MNNLISFLRAFFLLFVTVSGAYAQDTQQPLMSGTYSLDLNSTPLYYVPKSQYDFYTQRPILHIQTVPFQRLQEWGTRLAVVSVDTLSGIPRNGLVFLNELPDSNVVSGFVSHQTEPIYFHYLGGTMQLYPTYGSNPLERSENGTFNNQENWFSVYRSPKVETISSNNPNDEETTVWGTQLTIEVGAFNLFRSTDFIDIIFNHGTDSIPLYSQTDTLLSPITWFPQNENLFVVKDSLDGLWMKVSRFQIVPDHRVRLTSGGTQVYNSRVEEMTGWIRTENRYRGNWVRHQNELTEFRFEVAGASPEETAYGNGRGQLVAIKVIDKHSGDVVQVISDMNAEIMQELSNSITFIDANFDGYPDLMSDFADGGAGPNYSGIFYVFNPKTRRFEYHEALSGLSQVEVDTENQAIHSGWRSGAAQHGAATYRFVDGKLLQTYQWDQTWESDGNLIKQKELFLQDDSEWREKTTYWIENLADKLIIYHQADTNQHPLATLSDVAVSLVILEEKEHWYYVEVEQPNSLRGWVRKVSLFPNHRE